MRIRRGKKGREHREKLARLIVLGLVLGASLSVCNVAGAETINVTTGTEPTEAAGILVTSGTTTRTTAADIFIGKTVSASGIIADGNTAKFVTDNAAVTITAAANEGTNGVMTSAVACT